VEQELLTLPEHLSLPPGFSGVRVTRSLALCVCYVWSLFVLLYFFFWPLRCLFFFDIQILITHLVSSNSSCLNLRIFSFSRIFVILNLLLKYEKCWHSIMYWHSSPIVIFSHFVHTGILLARSILFHQPDSIGNWWLVALNLHSV
jgi:hypothetical protein